MSLQPVDEWRTSHARSHYTFISFFTNQSIQNEYVPLYLRPEQMCPNDLFDTKFK